MSTSPAVLGIHHVTAICGDPQRNLDFYAGLLGLRFVKKTVNFDDPSAYHLYYGDAEGRPGTILTFFAWPGAPAGRPGTGQATAVAFRVPRGALPRWRRRLEEAGVERLEAGEDDEAGENRLAFADPDGLRLELVEAPVAGDGGDAGREAGGEGSEAGPVPSPSALRGFHGVRLAETGVGPTLELLTDGLGYEVIREGDGAGEAGRAGTESRKRARLEPGAGEAGDPGRSLEVVARPGLGRGRVAAGSVHHVAFRVPDDETQLELRRRLAAAGYDVTPVIDRLYFRSVYFREPGGVLFEVATDPPGFGMDEPPGAPGSELRLPPWLEPRRGEIEAALPDLEPPAAVTTICHPLVQAGVELAESGLGEEAA